MRKLLLAAMLLAGLQTTAQTGFTIRGVVKAEGTPEGIPNVQVTLIAGTVVRNTVTTDNDGNFSFVDVSAGSYRIDAERAGYFSPVRSADGSFVTKASEVVTVTGQPAPASLSLISGGSIVGRVTDSSGRPIPGLSVVTYNQFYDTNGQRQLSQSRYALQRRTTNDRGEYRHFDLPPGDYFVAATSDDPALYERTFHPDLLDPNSVLPVRVAPAGEVRADIRMQTPRGVKISGKVLNTIPNLASLRGAPASLTLVPLNPGLMEGSPPKFRNMASEADRAEGRFEIHDVRPGAYDVFAGSPSIYSNIFFGRAQVVVESNDIDDVDLTIRQGSEVKIRLTVDGGASPFPPTTVKPTLWPRENWHVPFDLAMFRPGEPFAPRPRGGDPPELRPKPLPPVDASGAFMFSFVLPGRYSLDISGLPEDAFLAGIRQGGRLDESGVLTTGDSPMELEVLIETQGTTLKGDVQKSDQAIASNVYVALIPQGARRGNPAAHKIAQTDASGHFAFRGVAPGEYKLFAWKSMPPNAHLSAEFVARYEQQGQIIRVVPGQAIPSLRVITAVEP